MATEVTVSSNVEMSVPRGMVEMNYIDESIAMPADDKGSRRYIQMPNPGTIHGTRQGDVLHIHSMEGRFTDTSSAYNVEASCVRVVLFFDRYANGALMPSQYDMLLYNCVFSPRNMEDKSRYRIVFDQTYELAPYMQQGSERYIHFYEVFNPPVKVDCYGIGVSPYNIIHNAPALYVVASNPHPPDDSRDTILNGVLRTRYTCL